MSVTQPFKVVIAGGGVGALEAGLALRDLAGDLVSMQIVAPGSEFTYRPMTVREPFAYGPADHYPLADLVAEAGAELISGEFGWVKTEQQVAYTADGLELPYDALVLALGARPTGFFEHALTIDDRRMDELLHGVIEDVEGGYLHSIAFVAPPRIGWPLPLYELALMTAARAYDMGQSVDISIVTPEETPLAIFGKEASDAVAALLREAGITAITSTRAQIPAPGQVVVQPGDRTISVDRVIALPQLFGPAARGLPTEDHGFIPIDLHAQVRGVQRVYAAGDATDFGLKLGGIAAQQADAAAEAIAALAGADLVPAPFQPEIHAVLMTGRKPLYLTARIIGGRGFSSQSTEQPGGDPPAKIAARYLAPALERRRQLASSA